MKNDDPASAALRHLRDAEALRVSSPDQAWHLYGFAIECAWKLGVSPRWSKLLGHEAAFEPLLAWVADLSPRAPRSGPAPLGEWRIDHRYWRTGTIDGASLSTLASAANDDVPRRVAAAWARGTWSGVQEGP